MPENTYIVIIEMFNNMDGERKRENGKQRIMNVNGENFQNENDDDWELTGLTQLYSFSLYILAFVIIENVHITPIHTHTCHSDGFFLLSLLSLQDLNQFSCCCCHRHCIVN